MWYSECDMWYGGMGVCSIDGMGIGSMHSAGDCVYVRSDQEKPFIARIDRMWTDSK